VKPIRTDFKGYEGKYGRSTSALTDKAPWPYPYRRDPPADAAGAAGVSTIRSRPLAADDATDATEPRALAL